MEHCFVFFCFKDIISFYFTYSSLSKLGLPTPNFFGAMVNLHTVREFCPLGTLYGSLQTMVNLVSLFVSKSA